MAWAALIPAGLKLLNQASQNPARDERDAAKAKKDQASMQQATDLMGSIAGIAGAASKGGSEQAEPDKTASKEDPKKAKPLESKDKAEAASKNEASPEDEAAVAFDAARAGSEEKPVGDAMFAFFAGPGSGTA